jgi:hypothetical protein
MSPTQGIIVALVVALAFVFPPTAEGEETPYRIAIRGSQDAGALAFDWDPVPPSAWPTPQFGGPWTSIRYFAWATPMDAGFSGPYFYCNGETGTMGSIPPPPIAETTCRISGLESGKAYDFKVRGWLSNEAMHTNTVGVGDIYDEGGITVCCGPPASPEDFRLLDMGKGRVVAAWSPVRDTGGAQSVEYVVQLLADSRECRTSRNECSFDGLGFEAEHQARIKTVADLRESPTVLSEPLRLSAPSPRAARRVQATTRGADVLIRWKAPSRTVGQQIISYTVQSKPGDLTCKTKKKRCRITGLKPGRTYTFQVITRDTLGRRTTSLASKPVTVVTPRAPQSPSVEQPSQEPEKPSVPLG